MRDICLCFGIWVTCIQSGRALAESDAPAIVHREFIFTEASFPACHASTIVETADGLAAAWFGGLHEKHPSVGIWLSRLENGKWSHPVEVANGNQWEGEVKRYPCWNPVLFQSKNGPLILFFKVGPSTREWWGEVITSNDQGGTWSKPARLPVGIYGPIKNKPVQLPDETILCGSSTEFDGWKVHFETTDGKLSAWNRTAAVKNEKALAIIQPTLLLAGGDRILAFCRSQQQSIVELSSSDLGKTWSQPMATSLPNPNSGIDGLTLNDGRFVLVYNHTLEGRTPLNVALSRDGKSWRNVLSLETDPGEYSYPAVIQGSDAKLHITYTWRRTRIRYVAVDPSKL